LVALVTTVRDIERLRQIVVVLIRHGFGEIVDRIGLSRLRRESEVPREDARRVGVGERIRLVLQDLGPSFVKLGQILSTRTDLLPPDVIAELKKLQDRVPPVAFSELKSEIEEELGAPIEELFLHFDETPLASASIAQVHRAKMKPETEGAEPEEVVVKIQRPNIRATIERDIDLLYMLARAIERNIPEARIYSPVGFVSEFDRAITDELDFTREADHAERFLRSFAGIAEVRFPRVHRKASARRVLTLEYFPGIKLQEALARGYSGEKIAKATWRALLKQIYEDGFFHGDPHPGNILIMGTPEEPVICFIDLGLVGRLSADMRDKVVDLMIAAAKQDGRGLADALYGIGTPTRRIDRARYEAEVMMLAEKYLGKPINEIELSGLIRDIVAGALKYGLEIPPEFLMLGRTLMTVEGVGKEIYPELDVFTESQPFFAKLLWRRYSPERLGQDALRAVSRLSGTATSLPRKLDDVLDDLRSGNLVVKANDPAIAPSTELLGRRLFSGFTVAALILGGSHLLSARTAELAGWIMLGLAGVWISLHILRAAITTRKMERER
jgi:ubiquinone biosynthesis protein